MTTGRRWISEGQTKPQSHWHVKWRAAALWSNMIQHKRSQPEFVLTLPRSHLQLDSTGHEMTQPCVVSPGLRLKFEPQLSFSCQTLLCLLCLCIYWRPLLLNHSLYCSTALHCSVPTLWCFSLQRGGRGSCQEVEAEILPSFSERGSQRQRGWATEPLWI